VRVLVAEDDRDIRALIEISLLDHDVVGVADGVEALDAIQAQGFDAAVLDVMMPEVDGLMVCRGIRNHDRLAGIPVVMLTAKVGEDDHIKAFEAGADGYMTKPFEPTDLVEMVELLAATPQQRRVDDRSEKLRQAQFLRQLQHRF
jgi:DNA-binding response OmpR family regulator